MFMERRKFIGTLPLAVGGVLAASATQVHAQTQTSDGILNVMDFGAVGDGVTDDGPAIQKATNYAASLGKDLFFPAATYRLLTYVTWPSNTSWHGEPGSIIFLDPAMTVGASLGGAARCVYSNATAGLALHGLTFQSVTSGLTKPISICVNQTTQIRISNCLFQNFGDSSYYAQGIVFFSSGDIRIFNSKFIGNSGDGAALSNGCSDFEVIGCEFTSNGDWGLAISIACTRGAVSNCLFKSNTSTCTGADRCTDIAFTSNSMVNGQHGVRICKFADDGNVSHYMTVTGNVITGATDAGVSVEMMDTPGQCAVTGNTISGITSGPGIWLSDSSSVAVTGNSVYSCTGPAVEVTSFAAGYESGRHTIVGNTFSNCPYGVQQTTGPGTISKIHISGNSMFFIGGALQSTVSADYIVGNPDYFDFSMPINLPSGLASGSASAGGLAPVDVWQYMPIYIGGVLKKIAIYNP
jgi:hypothetical protein